MIILLILFFVFILLAGYSFYKTKRMLRARRKPLCALPADFGLKADEVSFFTEDGIELKGWFIKNENAKKTIILMHGWGMNKADVLKYTYYLSENYNLFYFDFRAQGESGGVMSGIGMLEIADVKAAINYVGGEVALYGISMGAAAAAQAASMDPRVKCVVLEAMFYTFAQSVRLWAWTHKHIPYFPVVPMVIFFMKRVLGADFEGQSPKNTTPKIKCPVFIIHGELDALAPLKRTEEMFARIGASKELWVVQGALHNNVAAASGREYPRRMKEFLKNYF